MENCYVSSVTADSRAVKQNSLFISLLGLNCDGHDFIGKAVQAGSSAVVIQRDRLEPAAVEELVSAGICVIDTIDTTRAYAEIAAKYYDNPAKKLCLVGITGTNGKTTVTYLVEHVLRQAGRGVGVIGTVNIRYSGSDGVQRILPTGFTTPEPMALEKAFREMVDHGITHVIMEVSSHGLAQARVGTLQFAVGAFTNLSRDHLDYHHDMQNYFQAKRKMFSNHLRADGVMVLPERPGSDEQSFWLSDLYALSKERGSRKIIWGDGGKADVRLRKYVQFLHRTELVIESSDFICNIHSSLVGRFNVDNILTTFAICIALGIDKWFIGKALSTAQGAPGRVQRITTSDTWSSGGPTVLVDYAHTPDALEKVLLTVNDLPHSCLFTVFGCGGDRDAGKRPLMGEIAARLSDVAIVTDDNPRSEKPENIIQQILEGVEKADVPVRETTWLAGRSAGESGCVVIHDRGEAISTAIRGAASGDIVVIAGKGHEPYQLTPAGKRYFDDSKKAQDELFSWTAELVAKATGGALSRDTGENLLLGKVSTDSRETAKNGIFVALKGENHDAHDYVPQAVDNGSRCIVVEKELPDVGTEILQIIVDDTTRALGDMAAFRRRCLAEISEPVVVGLTGSCGKTTVKEMVSSIFTRNWPEGEEFAKDSVLKTKGNFNNLIGLPLSLLPIGVEHRAVVLEMGMNMRGEIARLGEIADPNISCITNIHGAHLEGLGSIDGVAQAKEELFRVTKDEGTFIVNLDDPRVRKIAGKYGHKKITFAVGRGLGSSASENWKEGDGNQIPDLWASDIKADGISGTKFTLHYLQNRAEVFLHIAGEHNVSNALCAAAIGIAAGVRFEIVASGLADFRSPDKRMEMLSTPAGFAILNDSYNANPASMAAGLKTLQGIARGKTVAVLGDMLELGEASEQEHYAVGRLVAELKIDEVAVVGEFKEQLVRGAVENGFHKDRIRPFSDKEKAVQWLKGMVDDKHLGENDLLLVKASRGLRFETIVVELMK